jgi:allophanate hydrolase subunit 2
VEVRPVLGSRSRDTLAGLGPEPLRDGDEVAVGPAPDRPPGVDLAPVPAPGPARLRVLFGPRDDWFTDAAVLLEGEWEVTVDSDRVGLRLRRAGGGRLLTRIDAAELSSEGVVRGAVQVPPGGQPVLFLADHPVTGGYPVVAVVVDADTDRAAQLRPGERLRFTGTGVSGVGGR